MKRGGMDFGPPPLASVASDQSPSARDAARAVEPDRVEEGHISATRHANPHVSPRGQPAVLLDDIADSLAKGPKDFGGLVGGSVVDDDDLAIAEGLGQDTFDGTRGR